MNDVNEWSTEYNVKVDKFIDLQESPHSWDKRVLKITPVKNGSNYRFRLGLQMFRMKTNETYSLTVELYNRDYKTWQRQETFVNGIGMWVINHNTTKYQYHYGSSGDLYYTKTLIKFKKTSSSPPVFVYYTVHFDDNGRDLNTYPKDFINQIYLVAYGVEGLVDNVDPEVYGAHEAFEIDKTKMKMLVPLDMNGKQLMNVNYGLKFGNVFKIIKCFVDISPQSQDSFVKLKSNRARFIVNSPVFILTIRLHNKNTFDKNATTTFFPSGFTDGFSFKIHYMLLGRPSGCYDLSLTCDFDTGIRSVFLSNTHNNNSPFDLDIILSYK